MSVSIPQIDPISKSLTPLQRRIWHKVRTWDGDGSIPTTYLATAWGHNTTSLIGWQNTLYKTICDMNKRLAPHGIAIRGKANGVPRGGYRVVRLESERVA